jgi:hypothetical protein
VIWIKLSDKISDVKTTVTELLRDFPKIRRAAMRGDRVVIKTRSGNLVLTLEANAAEPLFGCLENMATDLGLEPSFRVFSDHEWDPAG